MTFKKCLEIGKIHQLNNIEEAIFNIQLHALNLFEYSIVEEELGQILAEREQFFNTTNFTLNSSINETLEWIEQHKQHNFKKSR